MQRKAKYFWARSSENYTTLNTGPAVNQYDLLATWRTKVVSGGGGLTLNLGDLTVWRIHLKFALNIKWSVTGVTAANDGIFICLFVDSIQQMLANPFSGFTNQYSQQYLMWDFLYMNEMWQQSVGAQTVSSTTTLYPVYKTYDIKTHRKFKNLDDTLWLQVVSQGLDVVPNDLSFTHSTLMRLPGR